MDDLCAVILAGKCNNIALLGETLQTVKQKQLKVTRQFSCQAFEENFDMSRVGFLILSLLAKFSVIHTD